MKRVGDLTAEDFPGVDPTKFQEWKDARKRVRIIACVVAGVTILVMVVLSVISQTFFITTPSLLLLIPWIILTIKAQRKAISAGLTPEIIRAAREEDRDGATIINN